MDGAPPNTAFWAKLQWNPQRHEVSAWHPLADHCADVAACCEALLSVTALRRRLARLGGLDDLTPVQVQRLSVLALLHDAGKANHGFQNKAATGTGFTAGHVGPILSLFNAAAWGPETERLSDALVYNEIGRWCRDEGAFARLAFATLAHHGRPVNPEHLLPDLRCWRPTDGRDPFGAIADLLSRARRGFPDAFATSGEHLPDATAFQHAFSGLVTLADWVGSDRRFFPYASDLSTDRMPLAREGAPRALAAIGLDPSVPRRAIASSTPDFEGSFGFEANEIQRRMLALPIPSEPSLTILESETGSGKTEAALGRFLDLFRAGAVDGLYFALPTRTAATQIQRRVVDAVERTFAAGARPPVVLAVPGYLVVDRLTGKSLPDFEVLWPDGDGEQTRYRGWAAENAKRYLAGAVVIGTIDQVLLSTLVVPHAHLRATALLRHLLVVDEVHASDAYMTRLLDEVLRRHLQAGGHALLMSATLGAAARTRLLAPGTRASVPPLDAARTAPYPAVAYRVGSGEPTMEPSGSTGRSKSVKVTLAPAAGDPGAVAGLALDAAKRGARVLVVRNTVRDCIATQEAVEALAGERDRALLFACRDVPAPHHARFASPDRVALDDALETEFGKSRPAGGRVAVATQTVQQSLDLDADLILTDLCPADVLLQRLGRLHRHADRRRPQGFESAHVHVLVPADRDLARFILKSGEARGPHGLGTVYADLLVLEATWRLLERHAEIVIPEMNRDLVERATHPDALRTLADALGQGWSGHLTWQAGVVFADRGVASVNLLRWTEPFGEREFPAGDLDRMVRTRLGAGDRIAQFSEPQPSPFGERIPAIAVPAHLAEGIPADAPVDVDVADSTHLVFRFGTRRYLYDRLGLRPRSASVSADEDLADA